ncbi:peptide chain release factor N(5)-glutamine methyltransferase [Nitrospirillum amazonense]|uniref:Release factor glutamine methyltransferase n=1 Tax=Nitrospirillum amazonense TaxID=28077 RepID=A0A560JVN2_9PROT|nr:peptide chain release factor N(5)-glutamine methyltransferase [Nitrospirillum amazonense]MDG3440600.1 peptide chain release factor N(5)-glutamine methyltransferase [Nitrospirillum amazonense]TWB75066.1 release factor glutamine methyltransferase [Nitrospirillum amazonense]
MSGPLLLRDVLKTAEERLAAAGCASPRLDVRLLAEEALGWSRTALLLDGDRPVSAEAQAALATLVDRRAAREPVSRILGKREFWSLEFRLAPDTLDPRPDTETLVETALRHLPDGQRPRRLLDLGTGSGCILLALLSELPGAWGLGVDIAPGAARAAAANAKALGFASRSAFLVGSWTDALGAGARFDAIVSNPPYIPAADIAGLEPEVRTFDPMRALDGGADGLDPYRHLAAVAGDLLLPSGLLAVEHGAGQGADVAALFAAAGLEVLERVDDLAGHDRVVAARRLG